MSFFTALTGLKGAQTDISTTSNNIANVGSNGFKKSRAEFGDIFGSTPLQSQTVGQGTSVKGISQQFGQGNITTSSNTLDMAISGQGFFAMEAGGVAAQTVYTRNGSFNVDDSGFIVDSNGQFLLGYPVDSDGAVADKTLAGSTKLELKSEFGEPKRTENISMGVNLSSSDKVLPADNIFSTTDPETYSSTSAVTIFDSAGNPQSATVYYLKTQQATDSEPNFKYDTKVFVDGVEIKPNLTRAVDPQAASLFIDKFGQQTTVPQDPAYILEGKGFPLYKADDLGIAEVSTPAKLTGLGLEAFLGEGRTVKITTDPLEFKSTMEYQALQNVASPVQGTFWGKDFLILDFDESGPVSIDIPPGTYNGTQLAEAVEVAARNAFGDDKKIQLTDGEDSFFSLDLKKTSGDGLSSGLATPIVVDLHADSYVITGALAKDGMTMDTFLQHAQVQINSSMNSYIQTGAAEGGDATAVTALQVDGKMFKKTVGEALTQSTVINASATATTQWDSLPPPGQDIFTVNHKEGSATGGHGVAATDVNRFIGYSNAISGNSAHTVAKHGEVNKPTLAAYDYMSVAAHANMGVDANGFPFIEVKIDDSGATGSRAMTGLTATDLQSLRLFQFEGRGDFTPGADATDRNGTKVTNQLGTQDIAIKSISAGVAAGHMKITLDFDLEGAAFPPANIANDNTDKESKISVLLRPSDNIAAYFESSEGLVEGVKSASYTDKIVIQETGASAKRTQVHTTTVNANSLLVVTHEGGAAGLTASGDSLEAFGFRRGDATTNRGVTTLNWVDDREPTIKIGYDEKEQRLTFDGNNSKLGLGTGIGMTSFTAYSKKLDAGESDLGIPAFGNNTDISLASDDKFLGTPFVNNGPDVRIQNKRYGMEVYFDTVNNKFDIKSGKTGEKLGENSAVGVTANQSASDVSVGRYKITEVGIRDAVDSAEYGIHSIGNGTNQIMGFPMAGELGYTNPTGLASKPAVATGFEALVDMTAAFTLTSVNNENRFTVVVDGVSALITLPESNYSGTTMATALESRINQMVHPTSGMPIGGVEVAYESANNNFVFSSGTATSASTFKISGDVRFGLTDVPLGIGETAQVKTPKQATDEFGRPLFVSPSGEITARTDEFADNIVEDFFPLYLDDGELTFNQLGELTSPITKVSYKGQTGGDITVDYSEATNYAQPFSAQSASQDGFAAGRLTNLEIDNYGSVKAGYSNGSNVTLGKIIIANFTNNSGLKQIGNSTFSATAASGAAELGEAAEDGYGSILSGSLEKSNVDITEELVNLITAQRNYQAAAKAMETTTSMTQTIINIRL
ncbi:flagellar hook-basal body complex protein [Planktomarina sp.]|nr:flagellar hook-basal body complex protein [Planktomarina sp.]